MNSRKLLITLLIPLALASGFSFHKAEEFAQNVTDNVDLVTGFTANPPEISDNATTDGHSLIEKSGNTTVEESNGTESLVPNPIVKPVPMQNIIFNETKKEEAAPKPAPVVSDVGCGQCSCVFFYLGLVLLILNASMLLGFVLYKGVRYCRVDMHQV